MELNYIKFTESVIDLVLTSLKEARAFLHEDNFVSPN